MRSELRTRVGVCVCVVLAAGCAVASGCGAAPRTTASRTSPPPLVLSSEFASGRVIASDGMGAAMAPASSEPAAPAVAGVEGQ